ncbi:MAG: threonine ammonia-lyase, biosynthetic [Burkholderiaceae bacterium]|nr:threonine ammonia-lyase, biosynthetic [Burkholderiaceae bacterium]
MTDYLKKILTSRVYDVATETPLELAPILSEKTRNRILLKREDMQSVFSFKLRGAYNKMARLSHKQQQKGVICASAGNHAQGVALAARHLRCRAMIVMPTTTPPVKVNAVSAHGGEQVEIVLAGDSFSDACEHALTLEKEYGLTFIHPFDDPDVIAGQGTIGMEILRQCTDPIHAIFVPVGGGGIIAGIAAYIKQVRPQIRVIGVETNDSDAMSRSIRAGRRVALSDVGLFADGIAVKRVGRETFRLARRYVDEMVLTETDGICAAIKDVFLDTRCVLEPAGALAVAGVKAYLQQHKSFRNKTLVAITSGANINFDRLRFVAEHADVGEDIEALFAVTIPETPGSFRRFCELVGPRHITEFNYRISDDRHAHVFVGLSITSRDEANQIASTFERNHFPTTDLSHDELSKLHIRHMVGGKSGLARGERLYRFTFPERPGALMRFLSSMRPNWNISLFHYRNHGADYGRVLVGLQIPPDETAAFRDFLSSTGYPCQNESHNPVYKLFLGS